MTAPPWGAFACLGFIKSRKSITSKACLNLLGYNHFIPAFFYFFYFLFPQRLWSWEAGSGSSKFLSSHVYRYLDAKSSSAAHATPDLTPWSFFPPSVSFRLRSWAVLSFASKWATGQGRLSPGRIILTSCFPVLLAGTLCPLLGGLSFLSRDALLQTRSFAVAASELRTHNGRGGSRETLHGSMHFCI